MLDKFSYQNLIITLIPGGFFVSVLILTFPHVFPELTTQWPDQDFLLTFMFVAMSFTVGEVIQTLSRIAEPLIDFLYFRGYRPSEIFLLRGNPVLNDVQRGKVLDAHPTVVHRDDLMAYASVSRCGRIFKGKDSFASKSQQVFRQIYTQCSTHERVQESNARYLFMRGMFVVFLLVVGWLCYIGFSTRNAGWYHFAVGSIVLSLLFLHRARGCGKGLVSEVAYLSTSKK